MESLRQSLLSAVNVIFFVPALLLFFLTTEKEIILSDVRQWVKQHQWNRTSDLINLVFLFATFKEFRNVYYYRLIKGRMNNRTVRNLLVIAFLSMTKVFYPEQPSFWIDPDSEIGSGFFTWHGISIVVSGEIGENCTVFQQVTIGKNGNARPRIGKNVNITSGAKVLGGIIVGDNVTVGANAVVVKNVPDNCVVVGIPAYIIEKNGIRLKEQLV